MVHGSNHRRLGLASATAAVAGEAIAVGIFLTPAGMARSLGSPFWLLVAWLVMAAMAMAGALCFGELAGRLPRAGGQYVFLREAFGRRTAFLFGWMSLLVLDPGLTAALAVGFGSYAGYVFGWSALATKIAAISAVATLCVINVLSVRLGAGFLRWLTWLKLGVLAALPVWAVATQAGDWSHFEPLIAQRPGSLPLAPALAGAMIGAFFSFGGWWDMSKIAGEVRNPGRTMPRAMVIGVTLVTVVYIVVSAVFVYLVPMDAVESDETFVAQAGEVLFGAAGGITLAAIVAACVLGSLAAFVMTAPRVYLAMARDGVFIERVARLHPRFDTPVAAIAIQGALAAVLVSVGTFMQIVSYFLFAAVAFLGLTVAGLLRLRRQNPDDPTVILTPGYPWTPLVFIALVVAVLALVAFGSPLQSMLGIAVVLLGIPVHAFVTRRGGGERRREEGEG